MRRSALLYSIHDLQTIRKLNIKKQDDSTYRIRGKKYIELQLPEVYNNQYICLIEPEILDYCFAELWDIAKNTHNDAMKIAAISIIAQVYSAELLDALDKEVKSISTKLREIIRNVARSKFNYFIAHEHMKRMSRNELKNLGFWEDLYAMYLLQEK